MALHSVHLSFTAHVFSTEPKAFGCVDRIMVDLLTPQNPNPHVKIYLEFCFRLDHVNSKIWSLDSFYGHHRLCTICFSKFCFIAFFYAIISLVAAHDWDTVKEKKYFFSVQVLFFYNPHGAVVVGRKPHFVPGRVFEPSHICINCFHLRHFLQFMSPDVGALFSILYLPNPATGLQLINLVSFI